MTASLGASMMVILTFFSFICVMLSLAVHMESTLERPHRHRGRRAALSLRRAHVDTTAPTRSSAPTSHH